MEKRLILLSILAISALVATYFLWKNSRRIIALKDIVGNTRWSLPKSSANDGIIRNCVTGTAIGSSLNNPSTMLTDWISRSELQETSSHRREDFKLIFKRRYWVGEKVSGRQSGIVTASIANLNINYAQEFIAVLHSTIAELKMLMRVERIRLLDLACGDMSWLSRFLETRDDVDFTGCDIVPGIVEHHRKRFANRPWKFRHLDMVADNISLAQYDLVILSAVLMHLTTVDTIQVLSKLSKESQGDMQRQRFLLATTFAAEPVNYELPPNVAVQYRYHRLNLEIPPVSLGPPLCLVNDGRRDGRRQIAGMYIGLWRLPLQKIVDCKQPVAFSSPFARLYSCGWSA